MVHVIVDKSQLKVDEWLLHQHLGMVRYTQDCQRLEAVHGMPGTLYVNDGGEIKEVTLALLEQSSQ
jgi:hypothetical protein